MGTLTNKEDLQNLLKEKEKGCGTCITIGISYSHCGFRNEFFCDNCKDKISILKQALEVIENEKKEISEILDTQIKEFIRLLKEVLTAPYKKDFNSPLCQITAHDEMCFKDDCGCVELIEKEIDKLAGEKLK